MKKIYLLNFILFFSLDAFSKKIGRIKMLRGKGEITRSAKTIPAKNNMWIEEGDKVTTEKKSFIRIVYTDKSVMNLGPKTEMEIKKFSNKEPGLVNLIKGQLRSKVTKDALSKGKKSKMYIKTKTAAMGIRGTDFHITEIPGERTSLVTYEGEVAMVQVGTDTNVSYNNMENSLNSEKAVSVKQGQFAGTSKEAEQVTLPVKISPAQLNSLKSNETFESASKATEQTKTYKAVTPPGVSAKAVTVTANLEKTVEKVGGSQAIAVVEKLEQKEEAAKAEHAAPNSKVTVAPPPEGMKNEETGQVAPPAGGPIDLKTGIYISPPPGSTFDANTGTYQLPPNFGKIDPETGGYVPPKGLVLTDSGDFITEKAAEKIEEAEEKKEAAEKKKAEAKVAENKPGTEKAAGKPGEGPPEEGGKKPGAGGDRDIASGEKPPAGPGGELPPGGEKAEATPGEGPPGPGAEGGTLAGAPGEPPPVDGLSPAGDEPAAEVVFSLPPPEIIPEDVASFEVPEFEAPPPIDESGNVLPPPPEESKDDGGGPTTIADSGSSTNNEDAPPPEDDGYVEDEDFFDEDPTIGDGDICSIDPCACGDPSCTEQNEVPETETDTITETEVSFTINVQ